MICPWLSVESEALLMAADMPVTCDSQHGNGNRMFEPRVDRNESLCTTSDQHPCLIFNQASFVPVMRREVEVSDLDQLVADSAHPLRVIPVEKRNLGL